MTAEPEQFEPRDPNVSVEGLPLAAGSAMAQVGLTLSDTFARLQGEAPNYLEWARILSDPESSSDKVRQAIFGLVRYEFGRSETYTEAYAQLARSNRDDLVRASAVRALNISRDESATPLFIDLLDDSSVRVRLEAAKALANIPEESAVEPLLARVTDAEEDLDVRIAAIDALKFYEGQELLVALTALLDAEQFSLAWQARRSLVTITGEDYGFDVAAWRSSIG